MPAITEPKNLFAHLNLDQKQRLYEAAAELMSDNKRQLFDRLVQNRTRHITVVLEDIFQSHNAAAVLRSCDCFGVQDVHVVEQRNRYSMNPEVAMGSNKWVDYYLHHDVRQTYETLRDKGYRIVATTPHQNDVMLSDLGVEQPIALVFGTELTGLTPDAIRLADGYVKIPMYGFTESFNISVSAALSLYHLTEKMRRTAGLKWQLDEEEQLTLKLYWCLQVIREGDVVVKELMQKLFA